MDTATEHGDNDRGLTPSSVQLATRAAAGRSRIVARVPHAGRSSQVPFTPMGHTTRIAPLYHQLYLHLRQNLVEGQLDPARALPSEPALVRQFGLSRVTVRRTLERLEAEGLIRRVRGRGTFPVKRPQDASARTNISGLLENLISYEQATTAINLDWREAEPVGEAALRLGREAVLRIVRVRSYHGRPISLTTLHVPLRFAGLLDVAAPADEPVIRVLDRQGVKAEHAEQALTAVAADELAANQLGVSLGAPLICMRRLMADAARSPVLHQESLYAPERFEYRMTLTRTGVGPAARWAPIA
jgi:GntR family transcriptional regulator